MSIVVRNTRIIAEALGKHIFALNSGKIFSNQLVCILRSFFMFKSNGLSWILNYFHIFLKLIQGVDENSLQMWMDYLTGTPRSTQLLAHKNNQVVIALKDALAKYELFKLLSLSWHVLAVFYILLIICFHFFLFFVRYLKNVKVTHMTPDKRDPELAFYEPTRTIMNVYRWDWISSIFALTPPIWPVH